MIELPYIIHKLGCYKSRLEIDFAGTVSGLNLEELKIVC